MNLLASYSDIFLARLGSISSVGFCFTTSYYYYVVGLSVSGFLCASSCILEVLSLQYEHVGLFTTFISYLVPKFLQRGGVLYFIFLTHASPPQP